jgi:hypothetical protein
LCASPPPNFADPQAGQSQPASAKKGPGQQGRWHSGRKDAFATAFHPGRTQGNAQSAGAPQHSVAIVRRNEAGDEAPSNDVGGFGTAGRADEAFDGEVPAGPEGLEQGRARDYPDYLGERGAPGALSVQAPYTTDKSPDQLAIVRQQKAILAKQEKARRDDIIADEPLVTAPLRMLPLDAKSWRSLPSIMPTWDKLSLLSGMYSVGTVARVNVPSSMLLLDVMSGRRKPLHMPLFHKVTMGFLPFNGTYLGKRPWACGP